MMDILRYAIAIFSLLGTSHTVQSDADTLHGMLELLATMENNRNLKRDVMECITMRANEWLRKDVTKDALQPYLSGMVSSASLLRRNILKEPSHAALKKDANALAYCDALVANAFPLFGSLYYLYYESSPACGAIEGGQWRNETVDGSLGDNKRHIERWLTDDMEEPSIGRTKAIAPRGFKDSALSDKKGLGLFTVPHGAKALFNQQRGGALQSALYFMLFLPTQWHRSMTGHAIMFLRAFCEMIIKEDFRTEEYHLTGLKAECEKLTQSIDVFLRLRAVLPVSYKPEVDFGALLDPHHFLKYVDWLEEHLTSLIISLTEMDDDLHNWSRTDLKESESYGPFPWGFVFSTTCRDHHLPKFGRALQVLTKRLLNLETAIMGRGFYEFSEYEMSDNIK